MTSSIDRALSRPDGHGTGPAATASAFNQSRDQLSLHWVVAADQHGRLRPQMRWLPTRSTTD